MDALRANGTEAKLVAVTDNNDIDREVATYRPSVVIVEALWVVPEKFEVLTKLHPKVKWVVRIHSKFAFLAEEGIALQWLMQYQNTPNVKIAFNDESTRDSFSELIHKKTLFLPTCYQLPREERKPLPSIPRALNVLQLRSHPAPEKNQLIQAVAAMQSLQ